MNTYRDKSAVRMQNRPVTDTIQKCILSILTICSTTKKRILPQSGCIKCVKV